jgi:hypothetical protein
MEYPNLALEHSEAELLKKKIANRPAYEDFLQVGAYGLGILDKLFDENFRVAGSVSVENVHTGYTMLTDGRVTYGVMLGEPELGSGYEPKVLIVARKVNNPALPDYDLSRISEFNPALAENYANPLGILQEKGKNGKNVQGMTIKGVNISRPDDTAVSADVLTSGKEDACKNPDAVEIGQRIYTRAEIDRMKGRNIGEAGTYIFSFPGSGYFYRATEKSVNTYTFTQKIPVPGFRNERVIEKPAKKNKDVHVGREVITEPDASPTVITSGDTGLPLPEAGEHKHSEWYTEEEFIENGFEKQGRGDVDAYHMDGIAYVAECRKGDGKMRLIDCHVFSLDIGGRYTKEDMEKAGIVVEYESTGIFSGCKGTERYNTRELGFNADMEMVYEITDRYWVPDIKQSAPPG